MRRERATQGVAPRGLCRQARRVAFVGLSASQGAWSTDTTPAFVRRRAGLASLSAQSMRAAN
eukprot:3529819-Lingulodinium_polyedra.AAC.1